jgi:hypothetical protein
MFDVLLDVCRLEIWNLVVAKVRERLAVNKQAPHRFHMQSFNLKKLNEVGGK